MKKKSNLIFWLFWGITILFLIINEPYALRWIFPFPELIVTAIVYFFVILSFLFLVREKKRMPGVITIIFGITELGWFFYAVYYLDSSYITRMVLLLITYICLLFLNSTDFFYRFWKYCNRFVFVQTIFCVICFVLVAVGLLQPLMTFYVDDGIFPYYFWGISFSKTLVGNLIRPSGFLDEPGALASWAVFGILFNYAFLKDQIIKKYMPYFTTVTLSVAYYIQMTLFLIVKNVKNVSFLILIILLTAVAVVAISTTEGTDFDLYAKTIARFEYDEESVIAGNSRELGIENAKVIFEKSPMIGIGSQNFGKLDEVTADNPYEIPAKDGIIGLFLTYLPFLAVLFVNRRKEILLCMMILAAGYLQRPFHVNFMHYLYLWSFFLFSVLDAKNVKSCRTIANEVGVNEQSKVNKNEYCNIDDLS